MIRPRAFPSRGHIAVLAISSPSEIDRIEQAKAHLEEHGVRVTLAPNIDAHHRGYLAGSDDERLKTLNQFLNSDEFDAFFFARGGYGATRILDGIDYDAIRRNPRPIVGFSDLTALHQALAARIDVSSFHGPMLNLDFFHRLSPSQDAWFWSMLAGEAPLTHHYARDQVLFDGEAEGTLIGGCLSLTTALTGTPYDYWRDDAIWFWEDVDEPVYRLDRMLTHLRLTGRMRRVRGVLIGKLSGCGDDAEVDALLRDFFAPFGIPVVHELPFGHDGNNLLMPFGAPVRVSTSACTLTFPYPAVDVP